MKKFICGFLCGAVLCTAIGAFAVNSIYENPYRITVNGVDKQIQGYNIDDYSYFKLRDIADAVGGFSVGFDNETILLSTEEEEVATPSPVSSVTANLPLGTIPNPMYIQVPVDGWDYDMDATNDEFKLRVDGDEDIEDYVYVDYIIDKANEIVGQDKYMYWSKGICDKTSWDTLLSDFPLIFDLSQFNNSKIPLEYYYQHIASWLRSLK